MEAGSTASPLIGLTTAEVRAPERSDPAQHSDPMRAEMTLGMKYARAIEAAGGAPVVIPPVGRAAAEALIDGLDAICLSGGPDIDPSEYGEPPAAELGPTEVELDRFELSLARAADDRGMPLLGICRGAQALNVARGGTLHQHLPNVPGVALQHRQGAPLDQATHHVDIAADSRVAALLGLTRADVNSFHHQAVDGVGKGLRVVAWATDGVVEAIEAPDDGDFVVGVQWHAEGLLERPEQLSLLTAFVEAGRRYGDERAA